MSAAGPAVRHPLSDDQGPGWIASETRAPLVGLSGGRVALLRDAAEARARVVLVTSDAARLTFAMADALEQARGAWVRRSPDGLVRDYDGALVPDAPAALELRPDGHPRETATAAPWPRAAERDTVPAVPWVQLTVSVTHPPRLETRLGGVAELVGRTFGGRAPEAWGGSEPLSAAWDREGITALARARSPEQSTVFFARRGRGALSGWIRAARSDIGVTEETRAVVSVPDAQSRAPLADGVRTLLDELAERHRPLFAAAWELRGPEDTSVDSRVATEPEPIGMLVGPRGVRDLGGGAARAEAAGAWRAGPERTSSLGLIFADPPAGRGQLVALLGTIGGDDLARALTPPGARRAP